MAGWNSNSDAVEAIAGGESSPVFIDTAIPSAIDQNKGTGRERGRS